MQTKRTTVTLNENIVNELEKLKRRYYDEKSMYIHIPKPELSTAENFLRLTRSDKQYTRLEAEILDLALILHAEHGGGNNSSLTVHVVSSADTDTYSAIAAAVGSLKGKRHGGANIQVMGMMDNIKENVKDWENEDEISEYAREAVSRLGGAGIVNGLPNGSFNPFGSLTRAEAAKVIYSMIVQ